ncbi:hypothetical protein H0H93_003994 [Arthromyces matolae]|nr:hypothetical protein H0H93_003994 [Arthromyces matolae]
MSLRAIVIDDTDPRIQYSPSWSADGVGGQDSFGTNGLTYNHTQHFTTANDSSLSFSFKGTSINVYGTVDVSDAYGWQNVIASSFEPPWECFVDNTSIGFYKPSSFHENNSPLCGSNSIASSSTGSTHNFTLKTWNMTQSATVWVDYLEYTPSSSDGEFDEDTTLLVPNNDSSISYDSSWTTVDGLATMTQTQGGKLSFNFTGATSAVS